MVLLEVVGIALVGRQGGGREETGEGGNGQPDQQKAPLPAATCAFPSSAGSRLVGCPGSSAAGAGLGPGRWACWTVRMARGEHRAGDVPVPGGPAADLVLAEPGDLLGEFVVLLDLPADPGPQDRLGDRAGSGDVDEEVRVLQVHAAAGQLSLLGAAAYQQSVREAVGPLLSGQGGLEPGPVVQALPFEPSPQERRSHFLRLMA